MNLINNFAKSESGAVTVDWIVLTAAIVLLGGAVVGAVQTGAVSAAGGISTAMTGAETTSEETTEETTE
mgnify:FL=1